MFVYLIKQVNHADMNREAVFGVYQDPTNAIAFCHSCREQWRRNKQEFKEWLESSGTTLQEAAHMELPIDWWDHVQGAGRACSYRVRKYQLLD